MIQQQDWLMRQIEVMIAAIVRFLFHTGDNTTQTHDSIEKQKEMLQEAISKGKLCQAEDWLLDYADGTDVQAMNLALFFYSEINKWSDDVLEAHNFSREEIYSGIMELIGKYGFEGIVV